MKIVLDTNVFISGIFFSGTPGKIIQAWIERKVQLVISSQIFSEYSRVALDLADRHTVDASPFLRMLATESVVWSIPALRQQVCSDPDDDKFLACALFTRTKVIVSGDKALLATNGYGGINVLKPTTFVGRYLKT